MKEFIEFLTKHLVDKPDDVHVNEIAGERTVVFELRVGDGDMGKVIGRHGQTARAIRTLLSAVAAKQGQRSVLEILENNTKEQKSEQDKNHDRCAPDQESVLDSQQPGEKHWQDNGGDI